MSEALAKDLVKEKIITQKQFADAIELQQTVGGDLEDVLIKLNFITEEAICRFKATKQGLEFKLLDNFAPQAALMSLLSKDLMINSQVIPLDITDSSISLAMTRPEDVDLISEIEFKLGKSVKPILSTPHSIDRCLNKFFYGKNKDEEEKKTKEAWEYTIDRIYGKAANAEIRKIALYLKSLTQALIIEGKLDRNDLSRYIRINFKMDELE